MADHRFVVPVQGVDNARRAIDVPAMEAIVLEQFLRIGDQPARREHPGSHPRSFEVQQQPRPLETMARGGAVGAKAVGRIFAVVLAQRLPGAVEMLDHQVVVGGCVTMDHALDNPLGTAQPTAVISDIGQGEEGFSGVHVAVGASVGFFFTPVAIEGFAHGAFFFAPETGVDDVDGIIEQGLRTGALRDHRRTGCQCYEGMQVGVLAGVAVAMLGNREPATVHRITQRPAQRRDTVIHQLGKTRQALNMGHGEAVGHARGVHGLGLRIRREATLFIEVAEAFRQFRSLGEGQQAQAFGGEPLLMGRCVQPTAEGRLEGVHGVPFLLL
ncbi:hypothetical protein D3C78_925830 [compost metagenome]